MTTLISLIVLAALVALFWTQVFLPMKKDQPLFPLYRKIKGLFKKDESK